MHIYEANYDTMTNNPPYPFHKKAADELLKNISNTYKKAKRPQEECVGLAGIGLPGDSSSMSRFIRAAFLAKYQQESTPQGEIINGFHILEQVSMIKGAVACEDASSDYTMYSVVYDLDNFELYYKLYDSISLNRPAFLKQTIQDSKYSFAPLELSSF